MSTVITFYFPVFIYSTQNKNSNILTYFQYCYRERNGTITLMMAQNYITAVDTNISPLHQQKDRDKKKKKKEKDKKTTSTKIT